jgi:hypothetical protein
MYSYCNQLQSLASLIYSFISAGRSMRRGSSKDFRVVLNGHNYAPSISYVYSNERGKRMGLVVKLELRKGYMIMDMT